MTLTAVVFDRGGTLSLHVHPDLLHLWGAAARHLARA